MVFYWDQPEDRSILKKCGKCKVLEYCSVDCQSEHWDLVHKKHCKKLVLAKKAAVEQDLGNVSTTFPVGLFSHHPFPLAGLLGNTMEMLIILNQRVLYKMAETGHPAWDLPEVRQFEQSLRENRQIIWAQRKLSPEKEITPDKMVQCENEGAAFFCQRSIQSFGDPLSDLWSTLHLVFERLDDYMMLVTLGRMKEPLKSVPEDVWQGVLKEVGPFSTRLKELISTFFENGSQIPSFWDLLKICCGGSLNQKCSFCEANVTVAALVYEVGGISGEVSTVLFRPHSPVFFSCTNAKCFKQIEEQIGIWSKWAVAVKSITNKMALMECNFCYKLTEDVHRFSYLQILFYISLRFIYYSGATVATPRSGAAKSVWSRIGR